MTTHSRHTDADGSTLLPLQPSLSLHDQNAGLWNLYHSLAFSFGQTLISTDFSPITLFWDQPSTAW